VAAADPSDLYGLPLDRFVPERGALAKTLRGEGDKEEAARVAALRKPSVAAWTVNQLIRTQRSGVASLFDAGDELRRAQSELIGGRGDAGALREAARGERRAVDDLVEVARGLLSSEGQEPTQATLDRVSDTLHAAALDDDARAHVRDGCLDRELRQAGFGGGGFESAPAAPSAASGGKRVSGRAAKGGGKRAADPGAETAARADRTAATRAERAAAEQAERRRSARMAEAAARREAELTARQLRTAQERRDRAAGSLREAEEAFAAARERVEEAELAHRRAQDELEGV
jgi:hypothetical protein